MNTLPIHSPSIAATETPLTLGKPRGIDVILLAAILVLLAIGTVEIYSASAVFAVRQFGSPLAFLERQLFYAGLGSVAMVWGACTDFGWLRKYAYHFLALSFLLLIAVFFVGVRINNARRWLALGPLSFQPVEVAKLSLVAFLACSLARKQETIKSFTIGFLPHLVVCGGMVALLLIQPDLGSSIILGSTTLVLLFVAGTKLSYLLIALLAAAPVGYYAIVGTPWRMQRLIAFLDPWQFQRTVGYQITESLISIGSGGLSGLGLGDGKQKLFYMPEAHSDFIMSNVGEELGFLGFAVVLGMFMVIIWRGFRAATQARDIFGTYLGFGITAVFTLQALVNTAVVLGAIPAKGLTLPFVSYGGTSLIMSMLCAGVLLNISKRAPAPLSKPRQKLSFRRNRKKSTLGFGTRSANQDEARAMGNAGDAEA